MSTFRNPFRCESQHPRLSFRGSEIIEMGRAAMLPATSFDCLDRPYGEPAALQPGHFGACRFASRIRLLQKVRQSSSYTAFHRGFTGLLTLLCFGRVLAAVVRTRQSR